jgi:hypothetical protein
MTVASFMANGQFWVMAEYYAVAHHDTVQPVLNVQPGPKETVQTAPDWT